MATPAQLPRVDLQTFDVFVFDYDADADVATVHLNEPRDDAERVEAGDGWYVRTWRKEIVAFEVHRLRDRAYTNRWLADLLRPALLEVDFAPNRDPVHGLVNNFHREGDIHSYPQLMRLSLVLLGMAVAQLSASRAARSS